MTKEQTTTVVIGIMAIIIVIFVAAYLIEKTKKKKTKEEQKIIYKPVYINTTYQKKKSLLTDCEKQVFKNIQIAIENSKLIVYPQINLATIIEKNSNGQYHNELFRNLDFCLFEKNTLEPICAIELNDKSHDKPERQERDIKVKAILENANIPLITLYTKHLNAPIEIKQQIIEATTNLHTIQ